MDDVIANAIKDRERLYIEYDPGGRLIEPHAFGRGSDNQLLIRAFQVEGESASGEHTNWKLLRLDRVRAVSGSGQAFPEPRPGYKRGDSAMKNGIIAEL